LEGPVASAQEKYLFATAAAFLRLGEMLLAKLSLQAQDRSSRRRLASAPFTS
jgi:hypothetical protein